MMQPIAKSKAAAQVPGKIQEEEEEGVRFCIGF
jgi:hypothetical protein